MARNLLCDMMPFKSLQKSQALICFFVFGLINNLLYVVILTAAADLVGPNQPKGIVLLVDIVPALIIKLIAPFYTRSVTYLTRIRLLVTLSCVGILTVSLPNHLVLKLIGVLLASFSPGFGEQTFMQLTHFFESSAIEGFSMGTGAAGLVGSFTFMLLTTVFRLSTRLSLLTFSTLPFLLLVTYYRLPASGAHIRAEQERQPLFHDSEDPGIPMSDGGTIYRSLTLSISRIKPYLVPYMLPLGVVYFAEYVINQGIAPTLLFDINETPFEHNRDAYVIYGTLYQLGVFISRSSASLVRIQRLYVPTILQVLNLMICLAQSLYVVLPNVYLVMLIIFYEGLLGGASYVNTYLAASEQISLTEREFAMGAIGISDAVGIVCAGLVSVFLESQLCEFQVLHGRPYCRNL